MTRNLRSTLQFFGAAALILVSTACGKASGPSTLSSIAVTPAAATVAVGHTQALAATGTFSDHSTLALTDAVWTTSSAAIATVSTSGVVTAKSAGTATITATSAGVGGTAAITVPGAALASIAAASATPGLAIGGTDQITVTGTYDDGSHQNLSATATYTTTPATGIVTVSAGGLITGVAAGSASIAVTASGKTAPTPVAVTVSAPVLVSLAVTPGPVVLGAVGNTQQLVVTGTYDVGLTQVLTSMATFTIAPAGVATVSSPGGLVTASAVGTATITATVGTVHGTASVVVGNPEVANVFVGGAYSTGVAFVDFVDVNVANLVSIDATTMLTGKTYGSIKVALPIDTTKFSGGAFVEAGAARDLSAFDSLTFWAKASVALSVDGIGLGNNAGGNSGVEAEVHALALTTDWQQFIIPIPLASKFTAVDGLFHFAIGSAHSTAGAEVDIWFSDVKYAALGAGVIGAPSPSWVTQAQGVSTGQTYQINDTDVNVAYTINSKAVTLASLNPEYLTLASDGSSATVDAFGLVTGVSAGTANITAKLGTVTVANQLTVTVTEAFAPPTTLPPVPAQAAGANVLSLYSSVPGGFNGTASDKSANVDTWNGCHSRNDTAAPAGGGGEPYSITVAASTANPRKYVVGAGGLSYVIVEFLGKTGATSPGSCGGVVTGSHELDVSGMDHFHIDVWTPDDSTNFQVKLQDAGADGKNVSFTSGIATLTSTSSPPLATGAWLSYDLSLASSFPGLSTFKNMGTLVLQAPMGATFYVDNLYFYKGSTSGGSGPTTVAAAPTAAATAAKSLFSSNYTGTAADLSGKVDTYDSPCFGPPLNGGGVADYLIAGTSHTVKQYTINSAPTYAIIELIGSSGGTSTPFLCNGGSQTGANLIDLGAMDTVHFDVWSPTGSGNFQVHLVNAAPDNMIAGPGAPAGAGAANNDYASGANTIAASTWVPIDLKLTTLGASAGAINRLGLVKFFTTDSGTYYLDNIYFYNSAGPVTKKQMSLPVTFDDSTVNYGLTGFGGAEDSTIVADPASASNMVAKVNRSATAQTYAGTTVTTNAGGVQPGFSAKIPFTASSTKMSLRTYTPAIGIHVRLKVEDHTNGGVSVETEALTTVTNGWETLTFDFSASASGTAALDTTKSYDKATVFFDFGKDGATVGARTYYFDDMQFVAGTVVPPTFKTITFDDATLTYGLTTFGGTDASVVADPNNAANNVGKLDKPMGAQSWAGVTVSTGANASVGTLPFSATKTKMTVRVYSPDVGTPIRLKVEDASDTTHTCETEVNTTVAMGWQTLTFDFATQAQGTAALNLAYTFNKVSIFMDFNHTETATKTYYFDDLTFVP